MKPIDAVTGLPKSPDVAKLADTAMRQGDLQSRAQSLSFSKEVAERARTVAESHKPDKANIANNLSDNKGSAGRNLPDKKRTKDQEQEHRTSPHPSKGQILDIRGA